MTTDEREDRRPDEQPQQTVRLPRLSVWASGGLSLVMSASLVVVSPVGLFVAPLGLIPIVQWVSADRRQGAAAWGWVLIALAFLAVTGQSFLGAPLWTYLAVYILVIALPAASLEMWRQLGLAESRWIGSTVLLGCVGTLAAVAAASWPTPPLEALAGWFGETSAFVEESYRAVGVPTGELELAFDAVATVIPWMAPSIVIGYLVVVLFWLRPRLPILGFQMPVTPFEEFRNDEWLPAGFALAGLGTLFLTGTPRWVAVNILIAVLMLYFVQGLAMIRAHLARWLGKGWLVRCGVALLCLQGPLPLVVAALGIADGFFELRPRTGDDGGKNEADIE